MVISLCEGDKVCNGISCLIESFGAIFNLHAEKVYLEFGQVVKVQFEPRKISYKAVTKMNRFDLHLISL